MATAPIATPAFYTAKYECPHWIRTDQGPELREGRPAYVPGLPGLHFYYRQDGRAHILTEATTGLAFAREEAYGKARLHQTVQHLVRRYGIEGTVRQIERWGILRRPTANQA